MKNHKHKNNNATQFKNGGNFLFFWRTTFSFADEMNYALSHFILILKVFLNFRRFLLKYKLQG